MANGLPIPRIQSQHALACIKIASTTITRSEIMHQRGLLAPASWSVIYTLFQAVMCLLFLIATHNGTARPSEAWKKGELGIRLLATMRCFDNGAVRCLWIIKVHPTPRLIPLILIPSLDGHQTTLPHRRIRRRPNRRHDRLSLPLRPFVPPPHRSPRPPPLPRPDGPARRRWRKRLRHPRDTARCAIVPIRVESTGHGTPAGDKSGQSET